ncbi:MAG: hypothetical protein ACRDST_07040 [Pseudonocardiaceae bacterium]
MRNVLKDLSLLLYRTPSLENVPDEAHGDALSENEQERTDYVDNMELALEAEDHGFDPLLSEIESARQAMLAAEQRMRLLIAYGREFITPRGYRLEDLAMAAGLSISGVRTSYGEEEIAEVAEILGAQPRAARPSPREPR